MSKGEDWKCSIGHAVFDGDKLIKRLATPVIEPEGEWEARGCEDPRISKIDNTYYMCYGAYSGDDVRVHIATSTDLKTWKKHGHALKDFNFLDYGGSRWRRYGRTADEVHKKMLGKERSKAASIFPEKINGKYWMIFGEFQIWLASSDDGIHYEVLKQPFMQADTKQYYEDAFIEAGPAPIKTDQGWLLLYHSIDHNQTYKLSALLLDCENPEKILARTREPIFSPEAEYELAGLVDIFPGGVNAFQGKSEQAQQEVIDTALKDGTMPHVIFCPGAVVKNDHLYLYYGASDSVICCASTGLSNLMELLHEV